MKKKFILSFLISLLIFSLIFLGFGENIFLREKTTIATDGSEDLKDFEEDNKIEPKVKNEILFLLMGVDAKDVKKSKGTRTDTMMLIKVNFEDGSIDLLSIPRDTRVSVRGNEDKINHAHAFGGVELTMKTTRDFLNLDIDYYVKVDYRAVKEVVNAIGGVDIDVPKNMKYKDPAADPPLNIDIKKGFQTLNGDLAHDFLRYRSGYSDGDLGRIKAQQLFMKEFIKQTLKLKNIVKLPKIINSYYDYVETNIPLTIMLKGATSAKKIDIENMKTATVPGTDKKIKGVDYLIYNAEETEAIVEEMFGDYLLGQ